MPEPTYDALPETAVPPRREYVRVLLRYGLPLILLLPLKLIGAIFANRKPNPGCFRPFERFRKSIVAPAAQHGTLRA